MDDRLIHLFNKGLISLNNISGDASDLKILRAFLAEGFYSFDNKNKARKSLKSDYSWMLAQAEKMGVNSPQHHNPEKLNKDE